MGSGEPAELLACATCGAELPTTAKFCLECGAPVPGTADRETRRMVTLLFTDVTGSTAMGELLDPEAYRGVMGRYFDVARAAVERHGGTVEKFVGDAVLAVFGVPEIHEDDALRAVRAARDLNHAVAALSEQVLADLGVRLEIRTGVNSGSVVAGAARAGGSFATGDAVNTAARLEQAAAVGEILLGATTYALVRDAVEVEAAEPVLAKGKAEQVPAYRLLRVLDTVRGRRRHEDAALVGRAKENRALDDALERMLDSGRSHLVTVLGPPGIGKSRLVAEFLTRIGDRADVAQGRCISYGQGITYWPLVQAVRDALHLVGTESDELTQHALELAVGEAPDRGDVVDALMHFLGKTGTPPGGDLLTGSVRRLLEELASRRPLVLNIDDLHWAEPTLLDLLERMREQVTDQPLLFLCQARPELLEVHSGWDSEGAASTTVRLNPLSPTDTRESVAALLGGHPPEGLAGTVIDWSGGNPLFIEEIVAHLVESGVLERGPGAAWRLARPLDRAELPPTVTALLTSRLDRLPAGERDLLERVSVIGLEFATAEAELLVEALMTPDVAGVLMALMRRDLIRPVRSGEVDGWAFKHVLVRDAAYEGMAKSLRSELHARFADALAAGDGAGDEQAGFVAHHLEQAARYRRELAGRSPAAEALVDRAVQALVLAADHARDREREDTSLSYLQRAMALRPATATTRRKILARRLVSCFEAGLMDLLGETLQAFEGELDGSRDGLDRVFLQMMRGIHEISTGGAVDPALVSVSAQKLVALGRASDDALWIVRGLRGQSICSTVLALWKDAEATSDEVIQIGSPADARFARALHLNVLALGDGTLREWGLHMRHEAATEGPTSAQLTSLLSDALVAAADCSPGAAEMIAATAVRAEELYADGVIRDPTFPLLADAYVMNRNIDGAIDHLQRVNDWFRRSGDLGHASTYILNQVLLMLERGDSFQTVAPLVDEAEGCTSPYDVLSVSYGWACRAILALRSGEHNTAQRLARRALRVIDRTHQTWQQADLRRVLSVVPRATGDRALERRMLAEATAMYARKEIRSYDEEIRRRLDELGRVEP